MGISPFRLSMSAKNVQKVNGHIVSGYRIQFTSIRGVSIQIYTCSNFGFGRSLIAASARKSCEDPSNIMISRGMGALDMFQYVLLAPIMIILNILAFVVALIVGLITLPLWPCFVETIGKVQLTAWIIVVTTPLTLLLNIVGLIFAPLQVLMPELLAAIKYDTWDTGGNQVDIL